MGVFVRRCIYTVVLNLLIFLLAEMPIDCCQWAFPYTEHSLTDMRKQMPSVYLLAPSGLITKYETLGDALDNRQRDDVIIITRKRLTAID